MDNRGINSDSKSIGQVERGLSTSPKGSPNGYIRDDQFKESPFQEVQQKAEPRITIAFEHKDLSPGTSRFSNAISLNKNLALKKRINPDAPDSLMVHGNVEVHFYNVKGHEVPMTERWVRYWRLLPDAGTTVANKKGWHVDIPNGSAFHFDFPSAKDVPGWQAIYADSESVGQIQEFLAGSDNDGGVYFNTWTLQDVDATTRVIHFNMRRLTAVQYREALKTILKKDYAKTHKDKLLMNVPFIPSQADADTGVMILPKKKQKPAVDKKAKASPMP